MLILTRREGDSIVVGETVILKVLKITGKQVRIGIDAPRELSVRREETLGSGETGDFGDLGTETQTSTGLPGA